MPPEENKPPEPTPGAAPESNGASNAEDLATIKAELEEEKKAIAAARTMIQEKDVLVAAVARALSIATAVKASLEAQAKQAKVPAGAPPRSEISLEGLSPREKIAAGIQQKGGTS